MNCLSMCRALRVSRCLVICPHGWHMLAQSSHMCGKHIPLQAGAYTKETLCSWLAWAKQQNENGTQALPSWKRERKISWIPQSLEENRGIPPLIVRFLRNFYGSSTAPSVGDHDIIVMFFRFVMLCKRSRFFVKTFVFQGVNPKITDFPINLFTCCKLEIQSQKRWNASKPVETQTRSCKSLIYWP